MIAKAKLIKRKASPENPHLRIIRIRRFFGELFTATQYDTPNVDSCPHRSSPALVESVGDDLGQLVLRSFSDRVPRKSQEGEFNAYASDGSIRLAELWIKKDGTITLNGFDHFGLVKVVELTTRINQLIAELQAHTHDVSTKLPVQTFTPFVKEEYENPTVLHGSGEGI